jgi:hypothetical protein
MAKHFTLTRGLDDDYYHEMVPKDVVTVAVHPTVTAIEDHAFMACLPLTTVTMHDQVTTIGSCTFFGCSELTTINIPKQVEFIGNSTFLRCTALVAISLPDQVTIIENNAFRDCFSLAKVNIPDLVTTIGENAFRNCRSLVTVNIPDQVTAIENGAFYGCSLLTSIVVPQSVSLTNRRGRRWFSFGGCTSLEQRQPDGMNYHGNADTWLRQRFDNLPLHQACYNNNKNALITKSILHDLIQQHDASMLTSTDAMLMTPLHVLCCNPTATIEMIQMLKDVQVEASSMRNVMGKTPLMLLLETKSREKYSGFHDEDGNLLPVVGLLEQGLDYEALEMIMSAPANDTEFISELQNNDVTSGLLPFMYGASLEKCGLDVVYELASKHPGLIKRMQQESKKYIVNEETEQTEQSENDSYQQYRCIIS